MITKSKVPSCQTIFASVYGKFAQSYCSFQNIVLYGFCIYLEYDATKYFAIKHKMKHIWLPSLVNHIFTI